MCGQWDEVIVKEGETMKAFSYVVLRDFGFAPNPFNGYCTLATCKPLIRKNANKNDWVIGTGASKNKMLNRLVYVMRVDEKLDFNQYWSDRRFQCKKPILNGSLKQMYGDNIYHTDKKTNKWVQENSHHSKDDGSLNEYNFNRDLKSQYVLISREFWYFGKNAIPILDDFIPIIKRGQAYKCNIDNNILQQFLNWISNTFKPGIHADPLQFSSFERYDGKS